MSGNVLRRDPLLRGAAVVGAIDLLDAAIEGGGNRVPKMEEGVFFEADVDKHRLQPHLDVLNFALVNAPDNVARGVTLDVVFFEAAVFEQRHAALQFLDADDELVARLARGKA